MSHFQSLSAPFVDKVSSSDGSGNNTFLNNHYLQNNPAILQHLIANAQQSPGLRSKIAPIKYQRKEKEDISFEESRRRALAATELALASPRTKAQFLEHELSWDSVDQRSSTPEGRPSTAQFYADEEQQLSSQQHPPQAQPNYQQQTQNYSLHGFASLAESEGPQNSYSSADRSINEQPPATSQNAVTGASPRRPLSTSSNESLRSSASRSGSRPSERGNNTPQQHLKKLRSVPEGNPSARRSESPQTGMASEGALPAPGARAGGPRSSSVDAAISNIFSQNQTGERTPEEIATLIQAAGSAEALISHLLKDKAQAASQNSQLWRLVDKQRSMILSLNRDLEKAMKDKERYRKKLKEQLSAVPPLPTGADPRSVTSPTPSDPHDTDAASLDGRTSIKELSRSDTFSTVDEHIAPYPMSPQGAGAPISGAHQAMPDVEQHIVGNGRTGKGPSNLDLSKSTGGSGEPSAPTPGIPTPGLSRKRAPAPLQLQQSAQGFSIQRDEPKVPAPTDLTEDQAREVLRQQEALISPGLPRKMTFDGDGSIKSTTLTAPPRGLTLKGSSNALKSPALGLGLPLSPRPIDRPLASPLLSPRQPRMEGRLGGPLSPPLSPRSGFPGSAASSLVGNHNGPLSPGLLSPTRQATFLSQMAEQPVTNIHEQLMNLPQMASLAREVKQEEKAPGDFAKEASSLNGIAKGGDERLLIVPPALQTIDAKVLSTRMRARGDYAKGRDQIVFVLAIFSRTNGNELWRVEKDVNTLGILDSQVRQFANPKNFAAKLPNMTLFTNHSPANIEGRKLAIEEYFVSILNTIPLDQRAGQALCEYLSVDVVDSMTGSDTASLHSNKDSLSNVPYLPSGDRRITKEGSLRKRGKNFGGWKSRYFILEGPILRYFEHKGGSHLGSIRLPNAQIGKQSNNQPRSDNPEDGENQYRHAFLILEPKRNNPSSSIRHVLCADNDAERDEWVDCLLQYVHYSDEQDDNASITSERRRNDDTASVTSEKRKASLAEEGQPQPGDNLRAVSYENMVQGQAPIHGPPAIDRRKDNPSPLSTVSTVSKMSDHSGEKSVITGIASTLGGKFMASVSADVSDRGKHGKKKGFFGLIHHKASGEHHATPEGAQPGAPSAANAPAKIPPSRSVFGASLGDAVEVSKPPGVNLEIPSVVYRCIEYLDARNAYQEEGIFRLSGSNTAIRQLRERFNTNADVNLLADEEEYHDPHAIAGLLKLYLRELPHNLLTRDLHGEFVAALEDEDKSNRVPMLNRLVHMLPIENFTLLKVLAQHLIRIVDNAHENKMTVRNVGIVFSPTLNIPAGVFSLFILEYPSIFLQPGEEGYVEPGQSERDYSESQPQERTLAQSYPAPWMQPYSGQQQAPAYNPPAYTHAPSSQPAPSTSQSNLLAAPATAGPGPGLPSTPRRMNFNLDVKDERSTGGNGSGNGNSNAAGMVPQTPTSTYFASGGAIGGSMSLNNGDKKSRRQSTMLGLFSSSKFSGLKGKGTNNEESPNPFDENSMYDV